MRDRYVDELLGHYYEPFYFMVRQTAMLGTRNSELLDRDAQTMIDFLGAVYGLRQELIDAAMDLVIGPMMRVGLASDYRALASADMLDEYVKDNLILYQVKGDALEEINRSELLGGIQPNDKVALEIRNSMGFTSFHHEYEPVVRYARLQARADCGEPLSTLQTAIMRILGIGCESNIAYAQRLLERALLWGHKEAAMVLRYLWLQEGSADMVSFLGTVHQYLTTPSELQEPLAEGAEKAKAAEYCILIAAIRPAVRRNGGSEIIDATFADLINRDDIPFPSKLALVARHRDGTWLRRYAMNRKPIKIGFLC